MNQCFPSLKGLVALREFFSSGVLCPLVEKGSVECVFDCAPSNDVVDGDDEVCTNVEKCCASASWQCAAKLLVVRFLLFYDVAILPVFVGGCGGGGVGDVGAAAAAVAAAADGASR